MKTETHRILDCFEIVLAILKDDGTNEQKRDDLLELLRVMTTDLRSELNATTD